MYFQQYNFDLNGRKFNSDGKNSWLFSLVDSHDTLLQLKVIPWAFSVVFYTRSTTSELHKQELRIERQFKKLVDDVARREEALPTLPTMSVVDQPSMKTILPLGISTTYCYSHATTHYVPQGCL